ncbi:MAG: ADP-ribosylglycohydrolase family protein, partial [Bilifractor sp.]
NLGNDTDTTAAVAGGLAGLYYGEKQIPGEWLSRIIRIDWIRSLCRQLC